MVFTILQLTKISVGVANILGTTAIIIFNGLKDGIIALCLFTAVLLIIMQVEHSNFVDNHGNGRY